ncbi:MAG: hypothetical protein NC548_40945 [Lachnospiraceae bacterium]|nr:hypothetical protein [Lachnospiraceae bacterium]MCM1230913.1 hypothetical protein [Ruminococcus flavefaciens]
MADSIEYNRLAITDVRTMLSQQLAKENVKITINMLNAGLAKDKAEECAKAYNTLEDNIRLMISQVDTMLANVIEAVDNVDND